MGAENGLVDWEAFLGLVVDDDEFRFAKPGVTTIILA